MALHSVTVQRRSGDTFSPIPILGAVRPGEAIRYRSDGGNLPLDTVVFRVLDAMGNLVFEFNANLNTLLSGWVDTVAPAIEGPYTLTAEVRTFPFLTITHFASTQFTVSAVAPPPPDAPPDAGGLFGDITGAMKWVIVGIAIVGALVVLGPAISRIGSHIPKKE